VLFLFFTVPFELLRTEWRLSNIYGATDNGTKNIITLYAGSIVDKIMGVRIFGPGKGLDIVSLSFPEKSKKRLMDDLPSNIKKWQRSFLLYPDGTTQRVKVRFRGDNPHGWAYEKKSLRIKTKKKKLLDRNRIFNYVIPQDENLLDTYLSYYIGTLADILTPKSRMTELFINGKSQGVYLELAQINEEFLRRNNRMPVNLYKGEQYHTERAIGRNNDLFDNPSLWTKTSVFNQRGENDYSDLEYFLNLLRRAETSESDFKSLTSVADIDAWAKFSAYQVLVRSWHNDNQHNMRMLSDVWKGTIEPIIHDTGSDFNGLNVFNSTEFDTSRHSLLRLYHKSSKFLSLKYKYLDSFLKDGLLLKTARHVKEIKPRIKASWERDLFHTQHAITNRHDIFNLSSEKMERKWEALIANIYKRQDELDAILNSTPNIFWIKNNKKNKRFSLTIEGVVPVSEVTLYFQNGFRPNKIVYDRDGSGDISDNDILIPFTLGKNSLTLSAEFYANRVTSKNSINVYGVMNPTTYNSKTQFNILSDVEINIYKITAKNALTLKETGVNYSSVYGNSPSKFNVPVINEVADKVSWSGEIVMEGVSVIDYPVEILPGTIIRMKDNASIIFTNKLTIKGTSNAPVIVIGYFPKTIWGTFALHGKGTSGSSFSYLSIAQGSGYVNDNKVYSAMFSIHDTSNINIDNLTLNKNYEFDDIMHIVYGKNISINKCNINGSFSDAIDVDISTVSIRNCRIYDSGNDGIDLMSSSVLVDRTHIQGSKDKGVSIGEASNAVIINSLITKNGIGVEVKDSSNSRLIFSVLKDNAKQLNAYAKNWRYSRGGDLKVFKSIFESKRNEINADKKSSIRIYDSIVLPKVPISSKRVVVFSDKLTRSGDVELIDLPFMNVMKEWNIDFPLDFNAYGVQPK